MEHARRILSVERLDAVLNSSCKPSFDARDVGADIITSRIVATDSRDSRSNSGSTHLFSV
jgi:hypothetical protein